MRGLDVQHVISERSVHLRDDIHRLLEVLALAHSRIRKEVINQPESDVVPPATHS